MKEKTKSIVKIFWEIILSIVPIFTKRKQCAAYRRGWCKGNACGICTPVTEEDIRRNREELSKEKVTEEKKQVESIEDL